MLGCCGISHTLPKAFEYSTCGLLEHLVSTSSSSIRTFLQVAENVMGSLQWRKMATRESLAVLQVRSRDQETKILIKM